ncbi:MAG: DUF4214 domain-containing protein [Acidimicrobiales bacterium]
MTSLPGNPGSDTPEILDALSSPLPTDTRSVSRRRFLQAAAMASGAVAVGPSLLAGAAGAAAPIGPGDGVLVLVTMAGGNDGLNTVIPITDGTYHARRGGLAIPSGQALAISDDRALHPRLDALQALWNQGQVAVIDGVGTPGTNDLSHFTCMARWMGGNSNGSLTSGWLGRYIDGLPGGDDPFHGVAIGTSVPLVMQGQQRRAIGLPPANEGMMHVLGVDGVTQRQLDTITWFAAGPTGRGDLADSLARTGAEAIAVAGGIEPAYAETLPDGDVKRQLDLVARLINANLGIRVFSIVYGDFDGHANHLPMHDARLHDLNEGLKAFYNKLNPAFAARTLLLVVSEFGRRVEANHSAGTDHGAANAVLAVGAQVRGGFYGELPSLTALDAQGNLRPSVDFRSVYATVLDGWLGGDSNQILGSRYEDLGFVAPPAPARTTSGINPVVASSIFKYRAQVVRQYLAYFGRLPDSAGLQHWVNARRSGLSLAAMSDSFASSDEFRARVGHLDNVGFIDLVYRQVLGRAPDSGGLAYWAQVLSQGTSRGQVMVGFAESAEFVAATRDQVTWVEQHGPVARLYLAYFQRQGDDEGIRYWIGTGLPGVAVSNAFAGSDEFNARYGPLSNVAFVDLVYRNVLGRPPDDGGLAYWAGELARGMTRGQVMAGFAESAEFVARTGTLA